VFLFWGGMASALAKVAVSPCRTALCATWTSGAQARFPAEYLRVFSPDAETAGAQPVALRERLVYGRRAVRIERVHAVGQYALAIKFSDGHDAGIYSYDFLAELADRKYSNLKDYIRGLRARKLPRDPRRPAASSPAKASPS
jgi:DUF971 family protein